MRHGRRREGNGHSLESAGRVDERAAASKCAQHMWRRGREESAMSWSSFLLFLFLSLEGEGEGEEKRKRMRGIQRWGGYSVGRKRKRERGGGDVMSEMASPPCVKWKNYMEESQDFTSNRDLPIGTAVTFTM
jgi:hypothetical protein